MTNKTKSILVSLLVLAYILVPDLFPGPIDDLLVAVLAIMGASGKERKKEYLDSEH